jgi:hypothetical protein
LLGRHEDAEVLREGFVAGGAAEFEMKINSGRDVFGAFDFDGFDADVVGVFNGTDQAAAVEGDIKFAGEIEELAVVENDLRELMAERERVVEFGGIDAGGGIAGDVADVVGAGAARMKAGALNAAENFGRVFGFDEANLKIRAGGDLDVAGGEFVGDAGDFAELK